METLASELAEALALKERMKAGTVTADELDAELERLNYDDVGHLNNALKNMQQAMKRARKKEGEMEEEEEVRRIGHSFLPIHMFMLTFLMFV